MKTWETQTIADLGKVVTGKTPPSAKPEQFGDRFPFVTPSDIQFGNKHTTTERFLSERGIEAHKRIQLPKKTVCVVCIGATIGKVCATDQLSISNQQINSIIVDSKKHDPDFVFYIASLLRSTLEAYAGGAATPIVNKGSFSKIKLQVPAFLTQRKIAAILTAYDDLIEINRQRIALLEKMAEELYREWFVRMRFPGHKKTKFVKGVPEGWNAVAVESLVKRIPPGKLYDQKTALPEGKIPILDQGRSGNIGFHNNQPGVDASLDGPLIVFANHTCYQRLIFHSFSAIQNVLPFVPKDEGIDILRLKTVFSFLNTKDIGLHSWPPRFTSRFPNLRRSLDRLRNLSFIKFMALSCLTALLLKPATSSSRA